MCLAHNVFAVNLPEIVVKYKVYETYTRLIAFFVVTLLQVTMYKLYTNMFL